MDGSEHFLEKFVKPESLAVVGATNNPNRNNYNLVANLVNLKYAGRIYPVHPKEKEILGLKTYPSVKDIEEVVELAVISVSYSQTPKVLEECAQKGIKRVTVIATLSESAANTPALKKRPKPPIKSNNGTTFFAFSFIFALNCATAQKPFISLTC